MEVTLAAAMLVARGRAFIEMLLYGEGSLSR